MRYHRLRLADYRGIEKCEITFRADGITVIKGPNEAGKSSLGEAIDILFEHYDNSRHREVQAVKPVHADEGPEIELEVETGPYRFIYRKRYLKRPETTLTVTRPAPENLSGREAHDRVEAILKATIDTALWRALRVQQGEAITQPDLSKQTALSAALDQAAGGKAVDSAAAGLFERVQKEYAVYHTERGGEKKNLTEARQGEEELARQATDIARKLADLESDVTRAARLEREVGAARQREGDLQKELDTHVAALKEIDKLEADLKNAGLQLDLARGKENDARKAVDERRTLAESIGALQEEIAGLDKKHAPAELRLTELEDQLKPLQADLDAATREYREASALAELRRNDHDHYNDRLNLEQLKERMDKIVEAHKKAVRAEKYLQASKITKKKLEDIRDAAKAIRSAEARLSAVATTVKVCGLCKTGIKVDGKKKTVDAGEELDAIKVADRLRITVPDAVEITVTLGSGSKAVEYAREYETAKEAFLEACKAAGADDEDHAARLLDERAGAERDKKDQEKTEKDNLRDLSFEKMIALIEGLEVKVPAYRADRLRIPAIAADLETAVEARKEAESARNAAERKIGNIRSQEETVRNARDAAMRTCAGSAADLKYKKNEVQSLIEKLAKVRKADPDEKLAVALDKAGRARGEEEARVGVVKNDLAARKPEAVRALKETAEGSLATLRKTLTKNQTELSELNGRLKAWGEEGLQEQKDALESKLTAKRRENGSLFKRAGAAKVLYEVMCEERDKAHRSYIRPLADRIEQLGGIVFNPSFQVQLDDTLAITSRTLDGRTVPYPSLSGGTREQLALMVRLASALIVAGEGGVPVILDDTLGYSDPDRLKLMGAVLAKAARATQIIVLTCMPDRYSHVGDAEVISL
ncbi:MAG: AAA family ATPase [Planctomycetota bacterium]